MDCKCNINQKCMHPKHAKYSLPIIESDCEGCPLKIVGLPSMLKQVSNFLTDAVVVSLSGLDRVSERARSERLGICEKCPLHEDGRCLACGCSSRVKSEFSSEQCPLKFWEHIPAGMTDGDVLPVPVYSPASLTPESVYASEETYQSRIAVCDPCRHRNGRRCTGCSCNVYTLARIQKSNCPKELWP